MEEQKKSRVAGVEAGWKVLGSQGKYIGEVKAVFTDHLVVLQGRYIKHTWYIPVDHVAASGEGEVKLTIAAIEAQAEGWRFPPNASYHHAAPAMPEVPETTTMQAAGMSAGTMSAPEVQGAILDGQIDAGEIPDTELGGELTGATVDDEV